MLLCLFEEFSKAFVSGIWFFQYKVIGKVFLTNYLKHSLLCYVLLFSSAKLFCVSSPLHFNSTRSHVIVALLFWYYTSSCFLCQKKKKSASKFSSGKGWGAEHTASPSKFHSEFSTTGRSTAQAPGGLHQSPMQTVSKWLELLCYMLSSKPFCLVSNEELTCFIYDSC